MKTVIEKIDKEKALYYLEKNESNRTLRKRTVDIYVSQMKKGQWRLSPQGIAFDYNGRLIDGQHRLQAIIESGKSFYFSVSRGCDPEMFKILDTGKNRSAGDVLSISNVKNANAVSTGIKKYIMLRNKNTNLTRSSRDARITNADILNEYNKHPYFYNKTVNISRKFSRKLRLINKSSVMSYICFLHLNKDYSLHTIIGFFDQLNTYSKNSTVNLLREKLLKEKMSNSKTKMTNKYKNAIIIKAWNCYISGREINRLALYKKENFPEFK